MTEIDCNKTLDELRSCSYSFCLERGSCLFKVLNEQKNGKDKKEEGEKIN